MSSRFAKHKAGLEELAQRFDRHVVQGKKHVKLVCNRGERATISCSLTPSDRNALRQVERDLRRCDEKRGVFAE